MKLRRKIRTGLTFQKRAAITIIKLKWPRENWNHLTYNIQKKNKIKSILKIQHSVHTKGCGDEKLVFCRISNEIFQTQTSKHRRLEMPYCKELLAERQHWWCRRGGDRAQVPMHHLHHQGRR